MSSDAPEFDWDDSNRDHLALHNVTPEEAEEAVLDPHAVLLDIQSDEEERIKSVGITSRGRIIVVISTFRGEAIRPITAYAADVRLQGTYLTQRAV